MKREIDAKKQRFVIDKLTVIKECCCKNLAQLQYKEY